LTKINNLNAQMTPRTIRSVVAALDGAGNQHLAGRPAPPFSRLWCTEIGFVGLGGRRQRLALVASQRVPGGTRLPLRVMCRPLSRD